MSISFLTSIAQSLMMSSLVQEKEVTELIRLYINCEVLGQSGQLPKSSFRPFSVSVADCAEVVCVSPSRRAAVNGEIVEVGVRRGGPTREL